MSQPITPGSFDPDFIPPITAAYEDTSKADAYKAVVIQRMAVELPGHEFDQWLAMDVFDLALTPDDNATHYIAEYRDEFDIS